MKFQLTQIATVTLLFLSNAQADQIKAQEENFDPIVVTATKTPEKLSDVIQPMTVITARDISNTSATEVDDVLRFIPGIDLPGWSGQSQHPTASNISMYGLGGISSAMSRALVMVNGIPINDPYQGYVQWGRVPLENIDHVEVVGGGGSPLWGNLALGGVINIITKEPVENIGSVNIGYGTNNTYVTNLSKSFTNEGKTGLQIFAQSSGSAGYQQVPDSVRISQNTPTSYKTDNLQLRWSINPSNDLLAHLTLDLHQNNQQLETNLDSNKQNYYTLSGDVTKKMDNQEQLVASYFASNSKYNTANATYDCSYSSCNSLADLSSGYHLQQTHAANISDYGGAIFWSKKQTGMISDYKFGIDYRQISMKDNISYSDYAVNNGGVTQSSAFDQGKQSFIGIFSQVMIKPTDKIGMQFSGRLQTINMYGGYDGSIGGVGATNDSKYHNFSPRFDLSYELTKNSRTRFAIYEAFRAPTLGDMYYNYSAGLINLLSAPNLQPEKLRGIEVGYDFKSDALKWSVTAYDSWIDNYITSWVDNSALIYTSQNQNIASVEAKGVQTKIETNISPSLTLYSAINYAESIVKNNPNDPGSVGLQLVDVPRISGSLGLTYKQNQNLRYGIQISHVSNSMWNNADHTVPNYPSLISAGSHTVADAFITYAYDRNTDIYLKAHNLFNSQYLVAVASGPSPLVLGAPFQLFAGMKFKFN